MSDALAAGDKEVELARLKAVMAPVEERILKLLDDAAPATRIFGRNLPKAYEKAYGPPCRRSLVNPIDV